MWEHSYSFILRGFSVNLHLQLLNLLFRNIFFFGLLVRLCSAQKMPASFCGREECHLAITYYEQPSDRARCGFGSVKSRTRTWAVSLEKGGSELGWPGSDPAGLGPIPRIPVPLWGSPSSWELSCWKCKVSEEKWRVSPWFPLLSLSFSIWQEKAQSLYYKP